MWIRIHNTGLFLCPGDWPLFSFQEGTAEDKGVDLYVLERAFLRQVICGYSYENMQCIEHNKKSTFWKASDC